jgi:hypothetical protein
MGKSGIPNYLVTNLILLAAIRLIAPCDSDTADLIPLNLSALFVQGDKVLTLTLTHLE